MYSIFVRISNQCISVSGLWCEVNVSYRAFSFVQLMTVPLEDANGQHCGQVDILPRVQLLQLNSMKGPPSVTSESYGEDVLHDTSRPPSKYGVLEVILRRGINLDRGNWGDDVFFYCKLRLQSTSADEHYETNVILQQPS